MHEEKEKESYGAKKRKIVLKKRSGKSQKEKKGKDEKYKGGIRSEEEGEERKLSGRVKLGTQSARGLDAQLRRLANGER